MLLLFFVLCIFSIFGPCLSGCQCSFICFLHVLYFLLLFLRTIFFWVHVHFTKHPHDIFDLPPNPLLSPALSPWSSVVWTAAVDIVICARSLFRWRIPCAARCFINLNEQCRNNNPGNKRTISFSPTACLGRRLFSCPVLFTCFLGDLVYSPEQVINPWQLQR